MLRILNLMFYTMLVATLFATGVPMNISATSTTIFDDDDNICQIEETDCVWEVPL